jgi:tetratricopeptide (TPR) repeat protein
VSKKSLCLIVLALPLLLCIGCAPSAAPVKDRYLSSPPLEDQVAALKGKLAQSKGSDPTLLRELGLALLVSGDSHEAETLLSQARSQGVSDSLTFLGAALAAQSNGQPRRAQQLLLQFLEVHIAQKQPDPWSAAVAELAAHRLLSHGVAGTGKDDDQQLAARLLRIWQQRGRLPSESQQLLAALLGQQLRLLGDEVQASRVDIERGCPPVLYLSGPHGHLPMLDVLSPMPGDAPMSDPARPRYRPRSGSGCSVTVQGLPGKPGVFFVHSWLQTLGGQPLPLSVETAGTPWALYIDGQRHYLDSEPVGRRYLSLSLPAGAHTIGIKLGVSGSSHVQIAVPGAQFFDGMPASAPQPIAGTVTVTERSLSPVPPAETRWQGALRALLLMQQAYLAGRPDEGLTVASEHLEQTPRFAALRTLYAGLMLDDRSRPERLARDRARSQLKTALSHSPQLLSARLSLAKLLLQDEKPVQAHELLTALPEGVERTWQTELLRHRVLKTRGFVVEAAAALAEAQKLGPTACPTLESLVDFRREQQDDRGALVAAQALASCNPYSERWADALLDGGRLDEAQHEFERLLQLEPESQPWLRGLSRVLLARRDLGPATTTLLKLQALSPRSVNLYTDLANLYVERGQPETALQHIKQGLAELPESPELAKALQALGQRDAIEPYRIDGKQVIREFVARHGVYSGESAVLLLDRTVMRVFPSGARLQLTHNLIQVLTKEGIERFGEIHIPDGAEVLTLRTIKADGSTREPEEIPEKESISAPALEVGDYVEYEYIDRDDPSPISPSGFLGERFYFASADAPLDRSEYLLITPKDLPLQIDLRGPADSDGKRQLPMSTQTSEGDLVQRFWKRTQVPRMQPEQPLDQGQVDDWSPSVRVGSGVSLEGYVNQIRERRFRALRMTRELSALAHKVAGPAQGSPETSDSQVARVRKLDDWVRKNIHSGGSFDESASSILARKEGRRDVLLLAMCKAVGIPAEAWLVRPENNPKLEGPLPDVLAFSEMLVAVAPDAAGQPLLWVDPYFRHTPTGLVRPLLRGAQALRIPDATSRPPLPRVEQVELALPRAGGMPPGMQQLPHRWPMLTDQRRVELSAELDQSGSAQVVVRETLTGQPASEWRDQVEHMAEDKLRQALEQRALGYFFPGASLHELTYGPMDDDNAPLLITYRFTAPHLARQRLGKDGRKQLVLTVPYPLLLSRRYVTAPQRQLPLIVSYVTPGTLTADIKLPVGARVAQLAEPVTEHGFGSYIRQVRSDGGHVLLSVENNIPRQRILPKSYPAFVDFAAHIDSAEEAFALIDLASP